MRPFPSISTIFFGRRRKVAIRLLRKRTPYWAISHRILRIVDRVEDVLVAGTSERKDEVLQLLRDLRLRPIDAGPLEAARLLECMTALLLSINKQNKVKEAGLKVTGL